MNVPDRGWSLGLDLGGTAVRAVALDAGHRTLARAIASTPRALTERAAVDFVGGLIRDLGVGDSPVRVGIGASGPIDAAGVIRNPDTLPAFTGLDLRGALGSGLAAPVRIDNDAVTAAIAEARLGAAATVPSFLHVTLGTGVGVAVLREGRVPRGADGVHPEAGHLGVAGPTRPCYCGRRSCWEQGASRTALQRAAAELLGLEERDPGALAAAADAARNGDARAAAVFVAYGEVLADGLAALTGLLRPPVVVLGGSATRVLTAFRTPLLRALERISVAPIPELRETRLDDYGGAIGAALLLDDEHASAD